jgi:ACS family hexuronate transporter-like MFS transporter
VTVPLHHAAARAEGASRYRWAVLSVFVLSTAINYLDRATLSALAPVLIGEFGLSNAQYGLIGSAFSLTYAASAPFAGLLIDRFGLNRAVTFAVALWSGAGIATGFTSGLAGLVGCRAVLGSAEAAGIPAAGKAIHQYLRPGERALGNAVNQAGVSLGSVVAPLLATWIALRSGWRHAFVVTGALGLAWIPLWLWVSRRAGAAPAAVPAQNRAADAAMLRDRRLWVFALANALSMVGYFFWFFWTSKYMVDVYRLTLRQAAWYVWIPPVFACAGGFLGGGLSLRLVERGVAAPAARFRVCLAAAMVSLATAALPWAPTPGWASAGISLGIFAVAAFSVNMYTLPLDTFGAAPAGFAVSILVSSYGAVSTVLGPAIGAVIDARGYSPVTVVVACMPLVACAVLWFTRATR